MVAVAGAGLEAGAHAGPQRGLARVGDQRGLAGEDVDELVLPGMGVAQGGIGAGRQRGQVDAEIGQPEQIAERPLHAPGHPRGEGFRVVGWFGARRRGIGGNRDRFCDRTCDTFHRLE